MNNLTITGNLTRDAEIRHLPNGDPVASFSVADNQGKDKPAIFWNCSLFGKRAESLAPYLLKGAKVCVSGSVTEREFNDKTTGQPRKAMDVRVNEIDPFCGGKSEQSAPEQQQRKAAPERQQNDFADDDIPF